MFKQIALLIAVFLVAVRAQVPQEIEECFKTVKNLTDTDKMLFSPHQGPPPTQPPNITNGAYCVIGCVMSNKKIAEKDKDGNYKVNVDKAMDVIQNMKPTGNPPSPPPNAPAPPDMAKVKAAMTTCAGNLKDVKNDCDVAKSMGTCMKDQLKMPLPFMGLML